MAINNTEVDSKNLVEECFGIANAIDKANHEAQEPKILYDAKKVYLKHLRGKIWLEYKTGKRIVEGLEGKITDKAVESAVEADPEYFKAVEETNKAYHEFMVADDYTSALEAKKKAIEILARFSLAGWNSALKIADTSSIENFTNESVNTGKSSVEERQALREERKRRRAKEETEEIG